MVEVLSNGDFHKGYAIMKQPWFNMNVSLLKNVSVTSAMEKSLSHIFWDVLCWKHQHQL
jgi:hypothetical protein